MQQALSWDVEKHMQMGAVAGGGQVGWQVWRWEGGSRKSNPVTSCETGMRTKVKVWSRKQKTRILVIL